MDFVKGTTTEEQLLLALIEKVEDNTAAITQLIERGREKKEGNVLREYRPPHRFNVEEEARWIKDELEAHCKYLNNIKSGHDCGTLLFIKYMENVELLRANGFDVGVAEWPKRTPGTPPAPGECFVQWTPGEAYP